MKGDEQMDGLLAEAYRELGGCIMRRPGDICEVRKEFLSVALEALAQAIAAGTSETQGGSTEGKGAVAADAPVTPEGN